MYSGFTSQAHANQTINATYPTSCTAQSGSLGVGNLITDFDNGTFGTASGAPDQTPATDPYPAQVVGGVYSDFYSISWGNYSYVANIETRRNSSQHPEPTSSQNITDPENGATGRFFVSDPDDDTPTLNFSITNVVPDGNYELAFWAVNSELNGTPNIVEAVLDGIVSFSTGELIANSSALPWQRYAFVFNAGERTTISLSMASTETGNGGRDFYVDNVTLRPCALSGSGSLSGYVYSDYDGDNSFGGSDAALSNITVQLWDTLGDSDPDNDIYISTTSSNSSGLYMFSNIAPRTTYELRVDTIDSDLPTGATPGTAVILPATVVNGGTTTGKDFGFDATQVALSASKSVVNYTGGYSLPGEDVIYKISVANLGNGSAGTDSLFLVDSMPEDVSFYNADMDDAGNLTSDPIAFEQSGAGLNFVFSRDVRFAGAGPKPTSFSACNYTPTGTLDPNVAYICFNPKGAMAAGAPNPTAAFSFRARIN